MIWPRKKTSKPSTEPRNMAQKEVRRSPKLELGLIYWVHITDQLYLNLADLELHIVLKPYVL